jgi:hypothetical protein
MRRLLWIIPVIVLLGAAPQGTEEGTAVDLTSLRILDISDPGPSRETLYANFHVLDDLGGVLVVLPSPSDRDRAEKLGIPSRIVSVPRNGGLYVASLKIKSLDELAANAAILYSIGDIALIAATPEGAAALRHSVPHVGLENGLRPLNVERIQPMRTFEPPAGWKAGARAADPRIAAMVAQVNETNLQDIVQDLQDMGERRANSGAFTAETYLVNAFNAIGGLTVTTHNFSSSYSDNVIADLPGVVDPSVLYIVGAHYDSYTYSGSAPGADDNASGTATVLELARILSQYQFKYTIRFCCFSAEEMGLIGSDAYCDYLVNQGADVQAFINQDMNCYRAPGEPQDVDLMTNYTSGSLNTFCASLYNAYVPTLNVGTGSMLGGTSDHQSFTQHGFPSCWPFEDANNYSPYIHTSSDVIGISANDFILSKMISQGVLAFLATLAGPLDLVIQHTPLTDTTIGSGPYPVTADVASMIGTNVSSARLWYDDGHGYMSKLMVPTGTGDGYISSIPGVTAAGTVKYYIEAEDDQGNTERLPEGFGPDHFSFFVGIFDDVFADDFEINDNGWTHGGTGQDDWMRNVCTGSGGYDPGTAASGTKVWGNDLGISGYNGNYQPNVNNWLLSPTIDCTGYTGVHLRYYRWLTVEASQYDQAQIEVNGTQVYINPSSTDLVDTEWVMHDIDISAIADNNPSVQLRYRLTTNGWGEMGGWNIDDLHVGTLSDGVMAELYLSEVYFHASTGGSTQFYLNGDSSQAGRTYMLALSASGTSPGTWVNGINVPLNRDAYTNYCMAHVNNAVFANFRGTLDADGDAIATFNAPVITNPGLVGRTLSFAWITLSPVDFASNPVDLLIAP